MKMKASVLLNVLLATTLLSLILFSANTAKTGSGSEYDPWIDYNDDGKVDHKDLFQLAATYGTSGDPTKDVTVTNWDEINCSLHVKHCFYHDHVQSPKIPQWGSWDTPHFYTRGYKRFSVLIETNEHEYMCPSGREPYANLYFGIEISAVTFSSRNVTLIPMVWYQKPPPAYTGLYTSDFKTYEITADWFYMEIINPYGCRSWEFDVWVYVTA